MALFKILRGTSSNFHSDFSKIKSGSWGNDGSASYWDEVKNAYVPLTPKFTDGYCYFVTDTQEMYVDFFDDEGNRHREPIVHQAIKMIDWEEMITFYINDQKGPNNESYTLSCKKGMTWYDFIMSKHNPDVSNSFTDEMIIQNKLLSAFKINDSVQLWTFDELHENGIALYDSEINSIYANHEIIPEMTYHTE